MNPTMTQPQTERVSLYFKAGSSNKEYHISIEAAGDLFVVNVAYGRRGSTMSTGTKTQSPVDYETATKIFNKVVNEKRAKGYSEGPDGTRYQNTQKEDRVTGLLPQLLNPIDESEALRLLKHPDWSLQEKFDGRRIMVRKQGAEIHGINRKGLLVGLPSSIVVGAHKISCDFVIDGECIGDVLYAFDLLERGSEDLRPKPYLRRLVLLSGVLNNQSITHIELVETATDQGNKERLFQRLQKEGKEGAVFKRLGAPYTPGRSNSGGNQLKYKFVATCSAVVSAVNAKRSVELRLLNCKGWIPVGNCTIPANHEIPNVGAVVEIRYLYAFKESNALYQPVYLGVRTDIEHHDCRLSQLKYKAGGEEDAEC